MNSSVVSACFANAGGLRAAIGVLDQRLLLAIFTHACARAHQLQTQGCSRIMPSLDDRVEGVA